MAKVGEATSRDTAPRPRANPRARHVLPAPRSPTRYTTSSADRSAARLSPNPSVSSSLRVTAFRSNRLPSPVSLPAAHFAGPCARAAALRRARRREVPRRRVSLRGARPLSRADRRRRSRRAPRRRARQAPRALQEHHRAARPRESSRRGETVPLHLFSGRSEQASGLSGVRSENGLATPPGEDAGTSGEGVQSVRVADERTPRREEFL